MSNMIDSFTSSSHAKQGFYGKQLKILGSCSSSPTAIGAELEVIVKIHVIENAWTTCPLLPSSTILHRWKAMHLDTCNQTDGEFAQDDLASSDGAYPRDEKDTSWVQASADRNESPALSPTSDQHTKRRPLSTSSVSSYSAQIAPKTHVAVLSNALCFVANKAGDYLVQLSIRAPFVEGTGSRSIHLSYIPRCRANFIKFQARPSNNDTEESHGAGLENATNAASGSHESATLDGKDGFEFNIHPKVISLDEAHLNPESDEDAQFWLEVQELLVGRDKFVGKLVGCEVNGSSTEKQDSHPTDTESDDNADAFEISGCFAPSSSIHISWVPQGAAAFVQDIEQDMTVQITGLPDQTKNSTLVQNRRRKDPEDSHALDQADQEEGPEHYEQLEMDDSDLVLSVEDTLTLNIQKIGWKQPFMDFTIELPDTPQGQGQGQGQGQPNDNKMIDVRIIDVRGDAVQSWEAKEPAPGSSSELDPLEKESAADQETYTPYTPSVYRAWFCSGTEGTTEVHVSIRVGQGVNVGYGKDIVCHIPKLRVHGTNTDKGRIHVCTSNDLVIQRSNTHLVESLPSDGPSSLEDGIASRHHPVLQYQYQTPAYELGVVVHRYQALARIARIERVRAEIGVSNPQQPGFARIVLSNIMLSHDDPYLRVYQLDGAEVWSVLVDGKPCSKSIQVTDRKMTGKRAVLVPIPEESTDSDNLHQVEISYGFNTFDRAHEENPDDSSLMSTLRLVVPGFSLPVGEYVVVASLPKLEQGMDYDEPVEDFEIMSRQGSPGQRQTITYGAYMTLGRPKLSIRASKKEHRTRRVNVDDAETTLVERVEQSASANTLEPLDQISRSNVHATVVAHDPQQPTIDGDVVVVQQASQRHPQQPLELQHPYPEHGIRANGTLGASTGATTGQTSNLSPQVGSPASFRSAGQMRFNVLEWRTMSAAQCQYQLGLWWKQVLAPIAALALVIMIINVAAFQETQTTSLDLVQAPIWRRLYLGPWFHRSGSRSHAVHTSESDSFSQNFVPGQSPETRETPSVKEGGADEMPSVIPHQKHDSKGSHGSDHHETTDNGDYNDQKESEAERGGIVATLVERVRQLIGWDST